MMKASTSPHDHSSSHHAVPTRSDPSHTSTAPSGKRPRRSSRASSSASDRSDEYRNEPTTSAVERPRGGRPSGDMPLPLAGAEGHGAYHHSYHQPMSTSPVDPSSSSSSARPYHEETLTVRRREANRLAAQRFRSRKKGYQDSLEERVRQLEDEKDALVRRLTDVPPRPGAPPLPSVLYPSTSRGILGLSTPTGSDLDGSWPTQPSPGRAGGISAQHALGLSPERHGGGGGPDPDVRIAALESANRRLQDELRGVHDENDNLREELDKWRRWERDLREYREQPTRMRGGDREEERGTPARTPKHLDEPPTSHQPYSSTANFSSTYPPPPVPPILARTPSYTAMPHSAPPGSSQGLSRSFRELSPPVRLPPLRLPPMQDQPSAFGLPFDDKRSPGLSMPYLPRTPGLGNLLQGASSRSGQSSSSATHSGSTSARSGPDNKPEKLR